jgi:hypothetical protein
MITGDHPRTAIRIAADLGIVGPGARALTGPEIERLGDEELRAAVREVSVYARGAPRTSRQVPAMRTEHFRLPASRTARPRRRMRPA